MSKTLRVLALGTCFVGLGAVDTWADVPAAPTFTKHIAQIFQEKCEACHRAGFHRADVARDLRGVAPVGAVDSRSRDDAADAAVAHLQDRWHSALQERSLAERRADRNDRALGRSGRAEGRPEGHAAAKVWPSEQGWNFAKLFNQAEPDLIIRSTPYEMKARANDAWWKPVVPTGLTEARWVRAIEIRPGTVKGRKITHHAIARLQQEEGQPGIQNADQGDAFRNAGTFMEWAVGKQGEIMRPNSRQADAARLADHLGHPLLRRRRGHHRRRRARHLLLSRKARSRSTARRCT